MSFTPFDWQEHDLGRLDESNWVALLNQGTGSGKTAQATWSIERSNADVTLVVAPAQTMETAWKPTVGDLIGVEAREIGNTGKAKRQAMDDFLWGDPGVYLVTPQLLARSDTSDWRGDLLVLDESHTVMTPKTKAQRALGGYTPTEAKKALTHRFGGRLAMSGTALRNHFELAWSYGRFLWPEMYRRGEPAYDNHAIWCLDRMDYETIYTGRKNRRGETIKVKKFLAEKQPGRWISEVPCVITHTKRQRCCDYHPDGYLPLNEPTVEHEVISLLPEQRKAIRELEEHLMTWLGDNPMVTEIPLTQMQRVRQVCLGVPQVNAEGEVSFAPDCKSPFYDRLKDLLDNEIEGETCVVFTDSQKFARVVTDRLNASGVKAFEYSGATRSVRDDNVRRLGQDFRVMVGVLSAAGTGLDSLQRVCKNEVWLSRDLDETINEQAEGRLDRMGQKDQVVRWVFHDDLGLSEGRFGEAVERRLQLNKSLRAA